MTEQEQAFKSEIENALKKWQNYADANDYRFTGGVMLNFGNPQSKGYHFMQSVCGDDNIVISNAIATIQRVPYKLKKLYFSDMIEALAEVDEEVEHLYNK
jgi:hypothetical protein